LKLLNEEILKAKKIKKFNIESQFFSKKNKVFRINYQYDNGKTGIGVIKVFGERLEQLKKEAFMLTTLKGRRIPVPEIYFEGKDYLFMEYLDGENLLDIITGQEFMAQKGPDFERQSNKIIKSLVEKVCNYLKSYYVETKKAIGKSLIMGDMNLRNFILKSKSDRNELYRVDFEDYSNGNIEEDLGSFCAFIVSYYPAFTSWKIDFAKKFFISFNDYFCVDAANMKKEIKKRLSMLNLRRGDTYPDDLVTSIINDFTEVP
jgi:tRNA A-37 threonylcarbamoyl transferase component Bud32